MRAADRVDAGGVPPRTRRTADRSVAVGRRRVDLLSYAVTVFLLVTLNFFLPRAMPGDPISSLEEPTSATYVRDDATRAALAEYYGLDEPLAVQYGQYLFGLARGDLGVSIRYNAPVSGLVRERLPRTLLLVGSALALATAVGLVAGVHSGWRRDRPLDRGLLSLFLALRNLPAFFLGSLALFVFSVKLGWFPLGGASTPFSESFPPLRRLADTAHHLALPASVMAAQFAAFQYLVMRASMVSELGSDYLALGRAKGLLERRLKYRHAARNAVLPVVSLVAVEVGFGFSISVLVETVFAYPGMGRLISDAVAFRDYPTLQACFLVLTLVVLAVNFLADVISGRLDPRTTG